MNKTLFDYYITRREHRAFRRDSGLELAAGYAAAGMPYRRRMADRFCRIAAMEEPHIAPGEQIVFMRTVRDLPPVLTEDEWASIRKEKYVHELGFVSNICPDYTYLIANGLSAVYRAADEDQRRQIDALLSLTERYRKEALRVGRPEIAETLARVPRNGARNFREALQSFRILHYALWLEGEYHNNIGRFDKLMFPYFDADRKAGLGREEALSLLSDFFLSFNKDSDLYPGVQQGDNGQSLVLGGCDAGGKEVFSELSELCLMASRDLLLIDPKINLRVSSQTPPSVYRLGTELTRCGLGFPQYSNDDVVIPGLIRLGYAPADAADYAVAACWEYIIPGVGDDIPNIGALNFPKIADEAVRENIAAGGNAATLFDCVRRRIAGECDRIIAGIGEVFFLPSPFLDLLRTGRRYRNYGIHGSGLSGAVDTLAAVEKYVYRERTVTPERLIAAIDSDFENDPALLHLLRYEAPKMGMDDEKTNRLNAFLLDAFADALEGKKNDYGGGYRAGTGTAMYYLWHARELGAGADGRRRGEGFGTNYSPSLSARVPGPVSVIRAATSHRLERVINGGPLTLEFASSVFRDDESTEKVAELVRYFILRGGHQLQLNTVNAEAMRDAQIHPEKWGRLVVRIWGWSAYFVELDKEFQDHVLQRQEYGAP